MVSRKNIKFEAFKNIDELESYTLINNQQAIGSYID